MEGQASIIADLTLAEAKLYTVKPQIESRQLVYINSGTSDGTDGFISPGYYARKPDGSFDFVGGFGNVNDFGIGVGQLLTVKKTFTAAQIKTMNSVPQLLIPAVPAGFVLDIISPSVKLNFGTTPFTSSTISLITDTAAAAQAGSAALLDSVATVHQKMALFSSASTQYVSGKGIFVMANADSAVGDGTITVYASFRKYDI